MIDHNFIDILLHSINETGADFAQCHFTREQIHLGGRKAQNKVFSPEEIFQDILIFDKVSPIIWGKLFKKKNFTNVEFNEKCIVLEDVEILTRIMQSNVTMSEVSYTGYYYRLSPDSLISQGLNAKKLDGSIVAHNSCIESLKGTDKEDWAYIFKYSSLFNWLLRTTKQKNWKEISDRIRDESRKDFQSKKIKKVIPIFQKIVLSINNSCPMVAHLLCKLI